MNQNPTVNNSKGTLYLVPVPLSPDTVPAQVLPQPVLDIVKSLRCFFVENLRSARRFLRAVDRDFDIDASQFFVIDEHSTTSDIMALLPHLLKAGRAGMISEAGCPSVADPGAALVELARANNIEVEPLVGPSSILLGLMASGFNGQNFAFNGYLPHDASQRKSRLRELVKRVQHERQTQIFIETPYRNNKLIEELATELPSAMRLCVAVELTSPSQQILVMTASQWRRATYDFSKRPAIFLLSD